MTKFTRNQKLDAVIRYQNTNDRVEEIAKAIGSVPSVVHNWIKQFEYHGLSAFEKSYTSHYRYKII
jgi:transposase